MFGDLFIFLIYLVNKSKSRKLIKKKKNSILKYFTVMSSAVKSKKYGDVIDLTEDDEIKKEPSLMINQYQSSTSQCMCNILIENQVS